MTFSSAGKNFGAQHPLRVKIWSIEKVCLRGYDLAAFLASVISVISGLKFTRFFYELGKNHGISNTCSILNIFIHFGDIFCNIRNRPKSHQILRVFGPKNCFEQASPKILDLDYKI